jgi:hypothetical protein
VCSLVGIVAAAVGLYLPSHFVSTVTLAAPGLEDESNESQLSDRLKSAATGLSDEALAAAIATFGLYPGIPQDRALTLVRQSLSIAPVHLGPSVAARISFTYQDRQIHPGKFPSNDFVSDDGRFSAQRFVIWAADMVAKGDRQQHGLQGSLERLDAASLGDSPTLDFKLIAVVLGPPLGLIVGAVLAFILRPPRPPFSEPQLKEA